MSAFKFDPKTNLVVCSAWLHSGKLSLSLRMALDTGATFCIIPVEVAVAVGCDPSCSKRKMEITTGSGIKFVPLITIPRFEAFGVIVKNLEVVCHDLPTPSPVEGLLGLNFLKKARVIIDFSRNIISSK